MQILHLEKIQTCWHYTGVLVAKENRISDPRRDFFEQGAVLHPCFVQNEFVVNADDRVLEAHKVLAGQVHEVLFVDEEVIYMGLLVLFLVSVYRKLSAVITLVCVLCRIHLPVRERLDITPLRNHPNIRRPKSAS